MNESNELAMELPLSDSCALLNAMGLRVDSAARFIGIAHAMKLRECRHCHRVSPSSQPHLFGCCDAKCLQDLRRAKIF